MVVGYIVFISISIICWRLVSPSSFWSSRLLFFSRPYGWRRLYITVSADDSLADRGHNRIRICAVDRQSMAPPLTRNPFCCVWYLCSLHGHARCCTPIGVPDQMVQWVVWVHGCLPVLPKVSKLNVSSCNMSLKSDLWTRMFSIGPFPRFSVQPCQPPLLSRVLLSAY